VKDQLLEVDVRLLLLRHGRQRVLDVLARLGGQTLGELDEELRRLERRPETHRAKVTRPSLSDVVTSECRDRPEIEELLRAIAVNFDNRTFLPHLRDVRRFFDRLGVSQATFNSRSAAGPALIQALSKLTPEELVKLIARVGPASESDYSLLSRAIMGSSANPRNQE
jgi:hypothetical protein